MAHFYPIPAEERPAWLTGVAQSADESAAPDQWRGLVAAWAPFLGIQGSVLYDVAGRRYTGTLTNMDPATDWVRTERGLALEFVGASSQRVDIATPVVTALPYTMMCWVWTADVTTEMGLVGVGQSGGTTHLAWLALIGGKVGAVSRDTQSDFSATPTSYPASTWFHAAGVWRTTTDRRAYLNGGDETTSTVARTPGAPTQTRIGARPNSTATTPFTGLLDDIRIYNRALEAGEIVAIVSDPFALYRRWQRTFWAVSVVVGGSSVPVKQWQYRQRRSA